MTTEVSANQRQVGGAHYAAGLQHWDIIEKYGVGYLEGCATKYLQRHAKKNGLEDLHKAEHYVQKLLELHDSGHRYPRGVVPTAVAYEFCQQHNLGTYETGAIVMLLGWSTREHLVAALQDVRDLLV